MLTFLLAKDYIYDRHTSVTNSIDLSHLFLDSSDSILTRFT